MSYKNKKDSLGDRMKNYENVTRNYLMRRTPVIIRCDGRAFHSFTRGFDKPYDEVLCATMQDTMEYLCENVQNCVLGYTQSDEISLVLADYKNINTSAWFDNNIQKMVSVAASLATSAFNKFFLSNIYKIGFNTCSDWSDQEIFAVSEVYSKAVIKRATFDARVFNIPPEEVCNCLIWRQQDAIRNSIQGLGQKYFSQKRLNGKNCDEIKNMLVSEQSIFWEQVPLKFQRGSCCIKTDKGWIIDDEIPLFKEDRNYVNSRLIFE